MTHIWRFRHEDDGIERITATEAAWPGPIARKPLPPHDEQTAALRRQWEELYKLAAGERVVPLLIEWQWLDRMASPAAKQEFLEPLLLKLKRSERSEREDEGVLVFLLLVCEPIRRRVAKQLLSLRRGLEPGRTEAAWHRREETQRLHEIERERLLDVTREATLEALYRCPTPPPHRFFGWLRETIAHRTLDFLRHELGEIQTTPRSAAEAEAMQRCLAGLDAFAEPELADGDGFRAWRGRVPLRSVFAHAAAYFEYAQVGQVCRAAVGRLPIRQQQVIEDYFFAAAEVREIAASHGIAEKTVYNHKLAAERNLRDDDCFFHALYLLGRVRNKARLLEIQRRYPEGRLPDGRRIVAIDDAA